MGAFWLFIRDKYRTYAERREFLRSAFDPLLRVLGPEKTGPIGESFEATLTKFDFPSVREEWAKATARIEADPDGAITAARTLVESVCKHILHELGTDPDDRADLPRLVRQASEKLNLAPAQYAEDAVRTILGGFAAVANGLAELRNKLRDAHGKRAGSARAQARHGRLAVHAAGALALFLIETWDARRGGSRQGTG